MNHSLKSVRALLSLAVAWASIGPSAPALAAQLETGRGAAPALSLALPLPEAALEAAAPGSLEISAAPDAIVTETPLAADVEPARATASDDAQTAHLGIVARLTRAVGQALRGRGAQAWSSVFDTAAPAQALGILPLPEPSLPESFNRGGAIFGAAKAPKARGVGGVFDIGPRALNARIAGAPAEIEASIKEALLAMVDADPAKWGVTRGELSEVHVRYVPGLGRQADTVYAYFQQQEPTVNVDGTTQNTVVNGTSLSFTVKIVDQRPILMAAMARLYPDIKVKTRASLTDEQSKEWAQRQLPPESRIQLVFSGRRIVYHGRAWHAANLYDIDGLPGASGVKIAVDIASKEIFAFDSRVGLHAAAAGAAKARAEAGDRRAAGGAPILVDLSIPHLKFTIDGTAGLTDESGAFKGAAGAFAATVESAWAKIKDAERKELKVTAALKPGNGNVVVINPTQNDENAVNQVNMLIWITRIHDWWSARLGGDARIDRQIPVTVNIHRDCNAYYTPGRPSLNFFRSSEECTDSGRPGVGAHEYGHFVDDMIGGITNGGMSEGWGDIGSMFLLGTPIVGEGFLKRQSPSWIRHGDNTYQYNERDEAHDQGQAWMGFAWKLRTALIASLGEAAGAARAEALIVPTLFAKASDIPSQMAQVLLNAMDRDGNIFHEEHIRAAAKAHGINLPESPGIIGG